MKLCSIPLVLYCRNCPKDDKFYVFGPHFEEVRGGVEPWLMARWKARVDFLLNVIELLFLFLTVEALQGKTCRNSLLSGGGWVSLSQHFRESGRRSEIFLVGGKLDTFCYISVETASSCVQSF